MGYPMAKNLLSGLGPEKTLLICDVSTGALDRFVKEAQGQATVQVINNGFEAIKAAVRVPSSVLTIPKRRGAYCVRTLSLRCFPGQMLSSLSISIQ